MKIPKPRAFKGKVRCYLIDYTQLDHGKYNQPLIAARNRWPFYALKVKQNTSVN